MIQVSELHPFWISVIKKSKLMALINDIWKDK